MKTIEQQNAELVEYARSLGFVAVCPARETLVLVNLFTRKGRPIGAADDVERINHLAPQLT